MSPDQRREQITSHVNETGKVDIEQLSHTFNVSPMTIRRDLDFLEQKGKLIRTHGGAVSPRSLTQETPYLNKETKNVKEKRAIARTAASFIPDGSSILLDSGTTTLELARCLLQKNDITVITNDIKIAAELMNSSIKVVVTGGDLQNNVGALFGPQTQEFLRTIHVDFFFLGAHAIDLQAGVTAPTLEKSLVKKLMLETAEESWLIADSSKLNQKAFSKVCNLSTLNGLIMDSGINDEDFRLIEQHVQTHIVESGD
ncbi:DeoR/GlpR family DNA-binding transcription regulator [Pseudalkalibacillus decolorationis]|uniref:DeoR/GlpR family DNA-binding transcription regulator n=1 Tax=Pseudalkalibacillus decolorationis TaxID=163879 RepID=UPI00214959AD|nr:DeoR/GlpR family DNA-binding transcription regulator [Pseudalkalibacillus decolorationis]